MRILRDCIKSSFLLCRAEEILKEDMSNTVVLGKIKFILCGILSCLFIIAVTKTTTLSNVSGGSMENTYKNNDWLLVNRIVPSINRGDIVVAKFKNKLIVKRVIGVGGDIIEIKDNQLYVNNSLKDEDYIKEDMREANMSIRVPSEELFLLGDNRNNSIDSRNIAVGCVSESDVIGRVVFDLGNDMSGYINFLLMLLSCCTVIVISVEKLLNLVFKDIDKAELAAQAIDNQ